MCIVYQECYLPVHMCFSLSLSLSLIVCLISRIDGYHLCSLPVLVASVLVAPVSAARALIGACPEESNIKPQRER